MATLPPTAEPEPDLWLFLKRGFLWRCPECGISPIYRPLRECRSLDHWALPLQGCPRCGYKYEREQGYFLLSTIGISYMAVGGTGMAAMFIIDGIFHLPVRQTIWIVLPALPVLMLLFIRHAKSMFMALDHFFDPHLKGQQTKS
jgi:uncharacterized protein (DUF983 family)